VVAGREDARDRERDRRFVLWAFDPRPNPALFAPLREAFGKAGLGGFAQKPPQQARLETLRVRGEALDPRTFHTRHRRFVSRARIGDGLFAPDRLVAAASVELGPRRPVRLRLLFDHSNVRSGRGVVLHGAQWREDGTPEGGMTVVALPPDGAGA
jgi:hypothetical protein